MNDVNFWVLQFMSILVGLAPIALGIAMVAHIFNGINNAVGSPTETDHRDLRATPNPPPAHTPKVETQDFASLHPTTPTATPGYMQVLSFVVALYRIVTRPRQCPNCGSVLHNGVCAYCGFEH